MTNSKLNFNKLSHKTRIFIILTMILIMLIMIFTIKNFIYILIGFTMAIVSIALTNKAFLITSKLTNVPYQDIISNKQKLYPYASKIASYIYYSIVAVLFSLYFIINYIKDTGDYQSILANLGINIICIVIAFYMADLLFNKYIHNFMKKVEEFKTAVEEIPEKNEES